MQRCKNSTSLLFMKKNVLNTKLLRLESYSKQLFCISIVALYIFFFFLTFKPFNSKSLSGLTLVSASAFYGLATFITPFIFISLRSIFKLPFFAKETWTLGKEILVAFFILIPSAIFFWIINIKFHDAPLNIWGYLYALKEVILLSIIPIGIVVILKFNQRLKNSFSQKQPVIVQQEKLEINDIKNKQHQSPSTVAINSENKSDSFELEVDTFCFANSEGNYVDIHFEERGSFRKKTIRGSIKSLKKDFNNTPQVMQCHRSYIVNTNKIVSFEGNSRGYKIQTAPRLPIIPVSRNFISPIKNALPKED